MMQVFLLALALIGLAIGGIAIKMFLIPGGTFTKTCGSVDPKTGKAKPCSCASGHPEDCDSSKEEQNTSDLILDIKKINP